MSRIIVGANGANPPTWPWILEQYETLSDILKEPVWLTAWPQRASILNGDPTVPLAPQVATYFEWNDTQYPAAPGFKVITGVTRDRQGNPLGGCTIKVVRTTDDVVEGTTTSNSVGGYAAGVLTTGNYYLVAFLSGSPDVEGVTDNNVTGS